MRWSRSTLVACVLFGLSSVPMAAFGQSAEEAGTDSGAAEGASSEAGEPAAAGAPVGSSDVGSATETKPAQPNPADPGRSHEGQIGVGAIFTGGAVVRVVYDVDENPCNLDDPDNPVCTSSAPSLAMFELSYGLSPTLTVALPLTILLGEADGHSTGLVTPMIRLHPLEPGMFNLFLEFGLPVAYAPDTDVGVHLGAGLQVDPTRYLGVRVGVFPTAFFMDELRTTFNFGGGLEVRFLRW